MARAGFGSGRLGHGDPLCEPRHRNAGRDLYPPGPSLALSFSGRPRYPSPADHAPGSPPTVRSAGDLK